MRSLKMMPIIAALILIACTAVPKQDPVSESAAPILEATPAVMSIEIIEPTVTMPSTAVPTDTPSPEPSLTPEPTGTSEPTDTPKQEIPARPYVAPDDVYTIAWISDPQHYSAKYPEYYESMTSFLRDHREELRLEYIIHTGDLVNKTSDEAQWKIAAFAQSFIDDIPNGVLAGNHDCQKPALYETYSTYFGESHYKNRYWYGGSYQNNRGHYDLLTLGQTDYLFVYMSFGLDDGCIRWLNETFAAYPDRVGFLMVHEYFNNDYELSKDGVKLFKQVVCKNPNLYMVLCGHRYGAYRQTDAVDDDGDGIKDRTVHQMMFNYQAAGKVGGDGYLRLIQVNESEKTMHVLTYSPKLDDFNRFDDPANREKHYQIDETAEDFILTIPWM